MEILEREVAEATAAKVAAERAGDADEVKAQSRVIERARRQARDDLRSHVMTSYQRTQLAIDYPGANIHKDVQIWQERPGEYASAEEFKLKHQEEFADSHRGVRHKVTPDGKRLYVEVTDLDLVVTKGQPSSKAEIVRNEEIKTGRNDSPKKAAVQLDEAYKAIREASSGGRKVQLLEGGRDITNEIDLTTLTREMGRTRAPADKQFDEKFEVRTADLDALIDRLLDSSRDGGR